MIAHVFGKVAEKFNGAIIVDVHGVGYEISVASGDFDAVVIDQEVKFFTHHHVREQAEELIRDPRWGKDREFTKKADKLLNYMLQK